jgi:hypothetical protein
MIRVNSRRHPSAALLLRRLSTGNDQARPRTTHDNRFKARSPLRYAGYAYRNRPNSFVTPSTASPTSVQRTSATDRQRPNPHSV